MNTEKPLSEIEKELYEVLADKTLSFGCKVDRGTAKEVEELFVGEFGDKISLVTRRWGDQTYLPFKVPRGNVPNKSGTNKIIGHEPTLNDVLLKLGEKRKSGEMPIISCTGGFAEISTYKNSEDWELLCRYDLTKSFDSQEEETKRRLHSLLCNNQER